MKIMFWEKFPQNQPKLDSKILTFDEFSGEIKLMEWKEEQSKLPQMFQYFAQISSPLQPCAEFSILERVASYHNIDMLDLISTSRKRLIVEARYVYFYIIRKKLKYSLADTGKCCGMKVHYATVIHAINLVNNLKHLKKSASDILSEIN